MHSTTFLAVGDWGINTDDQFRVAQAMTKKASQGGVDFVAFLGDNFYWSGLASTTDPLFRQTVKNFEALKCPWYAVLGNHDHDGNITAQLLLGEVEPRWQMPSLYYSLKQEDGLVEMFFLDTTILAPLTSKSMMLNWYPFTSVDRERQLSWLRV